MYMFLSLGAQQQACFKNSKLVKVLGQKNLKFSVIIGPDFVVLFSLVMTVLRHSTQSKVWKEGMEIDAKYVKR